VITCIGDLIGKYTGGLPKRINEKCIYLFVLLRFIHYIFFFLLKNKIGGSFIENDYFTWVNLFLFMFSNGFATTALMVLGVLKVKDLRLLNSANFINGFSITLGIAIGSTIALAL